MKSKLFLPIIFITGLLLASLSVNQVYGQTTKNKPEKQQTMKYACPQHTEIVQNKPGTCSKCGMTLVDQGNKPKENKYKECDSTKMKSDKKMKGDSTKMKKVQMMNDTASMKLNQQGK